MRTMLICMISISLPLVSFQMSGQSASEPQNVGQTSPVREIPNRPTEDWNRVRDLAHDEEINVWASRNRHVRCLFTGATDDYLFCEPASSAWHNSGGEYRFSRADVDKVRLEQGEHHFKTTVGVMALLGTIAGAAVNPGKNNGGERAIGALAGGLVGGFAGIIIAGPIAMLMPGHLVYQRPHARRTSQARTRTPGSLDTPAPREAQ